jgi:hypothetical protein
MNFLEDAENTPSHPFQRWKVTDLASNTRRKLAMRLVCWAFLLAGQYWTPTALMHFVAFVEASIEDERKRL